ncbi:MAG: SH3 domain-containing protein [Synechocystis sp.]|nr:SH3 domain-containing protein [Synechocystis sp.]
MTAMRRLSGLLQFVIGFILGVGLFVGGISLAGYFMFNRFAVNPEKPMFPEELPKASEPEASDQGKDSQEASSENTETPKAEATPTPTPTPTPQATLPPGAYNAQVVWGGSLIVRSEPSKQSGTVTSIGYRDEVIVLKNEGEWSQIKVGNNAIGWVRSGNLEKLAASESP